MKRRMVKWSEDALNDLEDQVDYIAWDNEAAAERIYMLIREAGTKLGISSTGRPGRKPATYEKVVAGTPYIIVYELPGDVPLVKIMRVFHGSQNWWGGN